jgi:hypothetical protein
MAEFRPGQLVHVPCEVQPGPFPDEFLITIKTDSGVVSGFVRAKDIVREEGSRGYLHGRVAAVTPTVVTVHLPGSFFTAASGRAALPADWARTHLETAEVE